MAPGHGDDFDVGERLVAAENLGVDLVELAQAALLRSLMAEHRPAIEQFDRARQGLALVDEGARNPGRRLGAQGERFAADRSVKVYISFVTISEVSPSVRAKTSVNSKIGVMISPKP